MAGHYNPADKLKAEEWARTLLKSKFYILDTETTGIGKDDQIVQIGIINQTGETALEALVKPTFRMPPAAQAVHGISDEMLKDALPFSELYVQLSALLAGQTIVAYNMDFDWRMLQQTAQVYGLPNVRVANKHCAMKEYARFKGQFDLKKRQYSWHSLSNACTQQKIPVENAHDALGDVRMTLALIRKMAE